MFTYVVHQVDFIEMNIQEVTDNDNEFPMNFDVISREQKKDERILQAIMEAKEGYSKEMINGTEIIFHNTKIVLPNSLISKLLKCYHESLNHPGQERTLKTILAHFYHRELNRIIKEFIKRCGCQRLKKINRKGSYGSNQLMIK